MAKEKSILDKLTDTVKGIADSASQALKAEEPARVDETSAAYMPFAAEGLVSDPLLLPPVAGRRATRSARKSTPKKSTKKPARKTARKSASARSKQVTKTTKRRAGARKAVRKRGRR